MWLLFEKSKVVKDVYNGVERGHTEHSTDRAHICCTHRAVSLVDAHLQKGSGQTSLASGHSRGVGGEEVAGRCSREVEKTLLKVQS